MRAAATLILLAAFVGSTLSERWAVASESRPDTSPLPLTMSGPPTTTTKPPLALGPLRCVCAPVADSEWHWTSRRLWGLRMLGVGVLSGPVGFGIAWSAHRELDTALASQHAAISRNAEIHERDQVAGVFLGVAAVAAIAAAALVLWPESHHVSVIVLPNGCGLVTLGGAL